MDLYNLSNIAKIICKPNSDSDFLEWINQKEIIPFLEKEIEDDFVIIFASFPFAFIHSAFINQIELDTEKIEDLLKWSCNPYDIWSFSVSQNDVWIDGPLMNNPSELLRDGRQILYIRKFDEVSSRIEYYEIDQMISQVLQIHFLEERNAWCKLDRSGDVADIVKIIDIKNLNQDESGKIVVFQKNALEEIACVCNYSLCRMFDFTRFKPESFSGWSGCRSNNFTNGISVFGTLNIMDKIGSYSRGIQIIDFHSISKQTVMDKIWGRLPSEESKKYVSFITMDWKNKIISEITCAPDCLANYFVESNLPFEISPAFFKPEVLRKYKSDRDKYTISDNTISCRGTWYLKSYGVNDAGQVFSYLGDLNKLPYEEQLHWKQYNERPKVGLPKRTIETDFLGKWSDEYNPLISLKEKLRKLSNKEIGWWCLKGDRSLDHMNYPYTDSKDEWAEEILILDQVIIEGLEEKWLRKKAKELGRGKDDKFRSLKLLEECLIGFGFEEDHAHTILSPLHEIHNLRSIKGHASGEEAAENRKKVLIGYGSFYNHYKALCSRCDETLDIIIEAFSPSD